MTHDRRTSPRIVVGVDGSPSSIRALQWALNQAAATGGSVEAVRAWDLPSTYVMAPTVLPGEDLAAEAEQSLAAAVDQATTRQPEVVVERRVVRGHPAEVLLEQAKDADLLVVGRHGHGGFVEAIVGSISQHCINHATCPVVVIPADG